MKNIDDITHRISYLEKQIEEAKERFERRRKDKYFAEYREYLVQKEILEWVLED